MMQDFNIQDVTPTEVPLLLSLIKELAVYEKLASEVIATESVLQNSLFGDTKRVGAMIAYLDKEPVGFAIYFFNFSSFLGRNGLYLEDLYIKPEKRGLKIGKRMLVHLAQIAERENCGRLEWSVLDWNESAIGFYKSLGAKAMDEWTVYRLNQDKIAELAKLAV